MKIYFGPSTRGFYNDDIHGARTAVVPDPAWVKPEGDDAATAPMIEAANPECKIPEDAVEISAQRYAELFDGQASGKMIEAGGDGHPVNVDRPKMSDADAMENLRIMRDRKLVETDGLVVRHRDELDMGNPPTLSDDEYRQLMRDRQALRDLPATTKDAFADYSALVIADAPKESTP